MDLTRQSTRAAKAHSAFPVGADKTGIDCHKGIAHTLPDMTGVPGWQSSAGGAPGRDLLC